MSNEIDNLLLQLQQMTSIRTGPKNTKEVWALLGAKNWEEAGFKSEEEAAAWLAENPYSNI